jgi:negative regulator of sigma E activity
MNEPLDDEDLIARYRALPRPEPSAALDAAVLAQARAAVRRTRPAWMAPIGAAAVVVLAVAVGWQLRGVPLEPVMPQSGSETAQSTEPARDAPVDTGAAAPAAAKPAARNQAPTDAVPAAPAQAPAPVREAKAERQRDAEDRAAPIAASPPAAARAATAQAPPPDPPPPPAEPAPLADQASKMQRAESAPAPPAPPAPPLADAPPAAPMAAEATLASELGQSVIDEADLDPEAWIDAIRRLRDTGDEAAARRELQRLLQRHPDLELPEDLRELRD